MGNIYIYIYRYIFIDIYIYREREREILLRPEATTRIKLKLSRFISQLNGYILLKRAVVTVVVW